LKKKLGNFSQKEVTMCDQQIWQFLAPQKTDWSHGVTQYYPLGASQKTLQKTSQHNVSLCFMASSN
jgi:hypothetical protein